MKNIIEVIIEIEITMIMMTTITIMEGIEDKEVSLATCLIFDYRKYRRKPASYCELPLQLQLQLSKFQLIKRRRCVSVYFFQSPKPYCKKVEDSSTLISFMLLLLDYLTEAPGYHK